MPAGWTKIAPTRIRAMVLSLLFILAVVRFAMSVVSAAHLSHGDFVETLPGFYAEQWNLTLWDSPDIVGIGFHRHAYGYGPTQYLTLWPIVFLDSYRQIAAVLLPIYVGAVIGMAVLLWRLSEALLPRHDDCRWGHAMTVFTGVFMFGPTLVALGQREFETVQALVIVGAAYAVARKRAAVAGGLAGYISMFKYWPLGLLGYFTLTRQWKAALTFLLTVATVLIVAHAVFDLARFPFASAAGIDDQFGRIYKPLDSNAPFCSDTNGTAASVHMGLCAIAGGRDRFAGVLFYGLLAVAGGLFLAIFAAFERRTRQADGLEIRWRRILEFCFFLIASGAVFHAHYYYLTILILPMTLMFYRPLWERRHVAPIRLALAVLAYMALSPLAVPTRLLDVMAGGDAWTLYMSRGIYLYGELLLVGLLFWEYWTLLKHAGPKAVPAMVVEVSQ